MKRILILSIMLSLLTIFPAVSSAQPVPEPTQPAVTPIATQDVTMPPIAVNYMALWNADTRKISKAPSIDVTLLSAFDRVLLGNFALAFPAKDNTSSTIVAGPMLGIDWLRLLSKQTAITVEKQFKLRTNLGALLDVSRIEGMDLKDWKKITYLGFGLGFAF